MTNLDPISALEANLPARIDYRLRSRAIARDLKRGKIFRSQVCDAHPELMKVAKGVGEPQDFPCPVCAEKDVVNVRYLFGGKLGSSGRCMADLSELLRITRTQKGIFTCYVVEVCTGCSWNFLVQTFPIQGKF